MSRDYEGCEDGLAFGRWKARLTAAANSKRGQRMLKDLEAELVAMQERGEARLITSFLIADENAKLSVQKSVYNATGGWDGKGGHEWVWVEVTPTPGVCALGAGLKKRGVEPSKWLNVEVPNWDDDLATDLDIATVLAQDIGVVNDRFKGTDEERFTHMLKWVRNKISKNGERITFHEYSYM